MEDAPPPTDHALRPHHVGLLTIFMIAFKEMDIKKLPAPFALHLYRVLLNEVSEVCRPKPHQELMKELAGGQLADADQCRQFMASVLYVHDDLATAEKLTNFFGHLPALFMEKGEEDIAPFARRSIFGYFCRRCFVSFLKLSFSGVVKLQQDFQAWRVDSRTGYDAVNKDQLNNGLLLYKTQGDKKTWAKPDAYEAFEKGFATGDSNVASESLRRFFEQHFHENNDSGFRQHALLNLARMHYTNGEYLAARKLITEAISVARTSGDRQTLQHCISLLHRLPNNDPGQKPTLNEVQSDLHPLEVLHDVEKLQDESNEQPLSVSFSKIVQAVGLYDHYVDVHRIVPTEHEQWAQHAVQSAVWQLSGCHRIAEIEEDIVLAFTDSHSDDNTRLTAFLNKVYRMARQGQYEESICMLLDPSVWSGLTLRDYSLWAHGIWQILVLRASRRKQDRLYRDFLLPHRSHGPYNAKEYFLQSTGPSMGPIKDNLYDVIQTRKNDNATSIIEPLLQALWNSEFLGRFGEYRTGIILMADVGLEFGMTRRCRRMLLDIMPQVINGYDTEQRAVACFTLARCIIACGSDHETLSQSIPYLQTAEADFKTLEMYLSLMDVQYMISVVYNTLGSESERDAAAARHNATQAEMQQIQSVVVDPDIQRIFEVIGIVGAALASR